MGETLGPYIDGELFTVAELAPVCMFDPTALLAHDPDNHEFGSIDDDSHFVDVPCV